MTNQDGQTNGGPGLNPYEAPQTGLDPADGRGHWSRRSPSKQRPQAGFRFECPCGRSIEVTAAQAGSTVHCGCGAEVAVPSLGRLREQAGLDRYESGPADTIRRMIRHGELPAGSACACSGITTDDVLEFTLTLPRTLGKDGNNRSDQRILIAIFTFAGPLIALLWYLRERSLSKRKEPDEPPTIVVVPLRVDASRQHKVSRMGQWRLKRLLRTVPIYGELLADNPFARVSVGADGARIASGC